jgi:1-acyl-sn-glycerol-3-phosphate acyltransferase
MMRKQQIYSLVTVPVFGFLYIHTAVSVILASFFGFLRLKGIVRSLSRFWARSTFWVLGKKVRVHGKENFEKGGKYIILANHSSLFDIMAIMAFYPGVSWFGREHLLKVPLFGYFLKTTGYIPMKQANIKNTKEMLEQLVEHSNGKTIAIFPEGTRTLDGQINRFHRGFIHVLKASKLDILPVTLNGLYSLKPKNRFYIDFNSKINVIIHPPIKNEELMKKDDNEIISIVKEIIESANCI